ncbi:RNA-directed DNA polymerase, eukaryota, reverse transcriptase zinc-binding domain protein [Tanacetum coccineum]
MGSHKSKGDDVSKIFTSIFITNFPVTFSDKDLFNACKQYGHAVDAYILIKRSKAKKRRSTHVYQKVMGQSGVGNSYVQVVKGNNTSVVTESDHTPTLVLDDECLNTSDLSNSLMGRVKEFASLSNLKMLIQASKDFTIEGRIVWVEIEGIPFKLWSNNTFKRIASKWGDLLHIDDQDENCFHSKRLCIKTKVGKNIIEAFKIIFRGKVCWIRAKEVTGWVPDFLEESDDEHDSDDDVNEGDLNAVDSDVDEVLETCFEERSQNYNKPEELSTGQKENHSKDPFNIYELLNKKKDNVESEDKSEHSPQYPPGYTPKDGGHEEGVNDVFKDIGSNKGSKDDVAESVCSGHFKKLVNPRTGGSNAVDSDVDKVLETCFEERSQNYNKPEELSTGQKENHSEDPFNIYELLNKKKDNVESEDKSEHSPQYPPGYTPKDGIETFCNNGENSKKECGEFSQGGHEEGVNDVFKDIGSNKGSKDDVAESVCSGHFKKSVNPRTGGSILNLMEELVKVGQTMGYNMDGCMNNMTEIIESQGVKEGFR